MSETAGKTGGGAAAPIFDDELPVGSFYFLRDLVQARKQAGRKATGVMRDYLAICLRKKRLASPDHYFKFRLYEHASNHPERIHQYVDDDDRRDLNVALNRLSTSRDTVDHKYYLEKLLGEFGVETVHTLAIVLDRRSDLPGLVGDAEGFRRVLAEANCPLFCKPVAGSLSHGALVVEGYDSERDVLTLSGRGELALPSVLDQILAKYGEHGYLLQRKLESHPTMAALSGNAIGSVRVVTLTDERSVEPLYAVWKVPAVNAIADNFWRSGNVVAHVDVRTGEVLRCRLGAGTAGETIETHPETGAPLVGARIPHWEAVRDLTVRAATVFHSLRIVGWDVAITPQGPAIIEGNTNPDHGLLQIAAGTGLYATEGGERLLAARAVEEKRAAQRKAADKALDRELRHKRKDRALSEGFKV